MSSRAIHADRSMFSTLSDSTLIKNQEAVSFTNIFEDYYTPITINGTTSSINHIIYFTETRHFRIQTSYNTCNDFLIYWGVNIITSMGNQTPVFSVVIENADNSIWGSFPSNAVRHTGTLSGSTLIHLPTPAIGATPINYNLSLINQSGYDCYYCRRAISLASILIICLE